MRKIRTIIFLSFLFFSVFSYAQSQDTLLIKVNFLKNFNFNYNTNSSRFTFSFNNIDFPRNNKIFSSYNPTTQLNDVYLIDGNNLIYSRSEFLFENTFSGNKIDSFNPYGSTDFSSALLFGVIGSILK